MGVSNQPTAKERRRHMNRWRGFGIVWGLVTLVVAGIVGVVAYNAGASSVVTSSAGEAGGVVYVAGYGVGFWVFWVFPLLFFLFIFFRLFCPGGGGDRPRGVYGGGCGG